MSKTIQALRGMNDLSPTETPLWQWVESNIRDTFASYGYTEMRSPIMESTDLFKRGVGEATDIVEKEMFTFTRSEEAGESFTLRPEGTAGCVRAAIEHGWIYNVYGISVRCSAMSVRKKVVTVNSTKQVLKFSGSQMLKPMRN